MNNTYERHAPWASKYSAGGVSKLLWYIETKETMKLFQEHSIDETREIVITNNLYSQKSEDRLKRSYHIPSYCTDRSNDYRQDVV